MPDHVVDGVSLRFCIIIGLLHPLVFYLDDLSEFIKCDVKKGAIDILNGDYTGPHVIINSYVLNQIYLTPYGVDSINASARFDLVDLNEIKRNDVVYSYQGNRNPFIDHPEYIICVFENYCSALSPPGSSAPEVWINEFHYSVVRTPNRN